MLQYAESIQKIKEQDRTLNNILHCTTTVCAETFDETSKQVEHMLSRKHSIPEKPYKLLCDLFFFIFTIINGYYTISCLLSYYSFLIHTYIYICIYIYIYIYIHTHDYLTKFNSKR